MGEFIKIGEFSVLMNENVEMMIKSIENNGFYVCKYDIDGKTDKYIIMKKIR